MKRLVERLRYQALQSDSSGEDRSHKQRIKHAVKSYHGAVIENLDTDPEHYVAVETIAANKYFFMLYFTMYSYLIFPFYTSQYYLHWWMNVQFTYVYFTQFHIF